MKSPKGRKEGFYNAEYVAKMVDSELFQPSIKRFVSTYNLDEADVKDKFRLLFGRFWVESPGKERTIVHFADIAKGSMPLSFDRIEFKEFKAGSADKKYPYGVYTQEMVYKPRSNDKDNEIKTLDDGVKLGEANSYFDHYFNFPNPFGASGEYQTRNRPQNPYYYELTSDYNYFVRKYENAIEDPKVPETILPKVYADLKLSIELTDLLAEIFGKNASGKIKSKRDYDYFSNYGVVIENLINVPKYQKLKDRIITREESKSIVPGSLPKKASAIYPMSSALKWRMDGSKDITKILKESNILSDVYNAFENRGFQRQEGKTNFKYSDGIEVTNYSTFLRFIPPLQLSANSGVDLFNNKIKSLLKTHFRSFKEIMEGVPAYSEIIAYKVEKYDEKNKLLQTLYVQNLPETDIFEYMDAQVKYQKLYKYKVSALCFVLGTKYWFEDGTSKKLPVEGPVGPSAEEVIKLIEKDFKQSIETKITPKETINDLYRPSIAPVVRSETQPPDDEFEGVEREPRSFEDQESTADADPSASPGPDDPMGFDTRKPSDRHDQLKKDKNLPSPSDVLNNMVVPYVVNCAPSLQLIEVPYFEDQTFIIGNPPMPPDVDVVPYVNKDDRMLFNLNARIETMEMMPISILPSDEAEFEKFDKKVKDGRLIFKSDFGEPLKAFQIFRTEKKPKSYMDFSNSLLATIETNCIANAASFVDKKIRSNRKYYYTFRSIDRHGHISNPSPVYEVQLINDSGYVYSIVRNVELDNKIKKEISRSAKKYIYIRPDDQHTVVDSRQFEDSVNIKSSIELGKKVARAQRDKETVESNIPLQEASALLGESNAPIVSDPSFDTRVEDQLVSAKDLKNVRLGEYTLDNEQLWNRRFKLRIKSKKTGRIIDFNFKCKKSFKPYEPEEQKKDLC